uniref:Uncharacterized protein n=1 Tax=Cannabis sativa TaxID=3483 RepID=A0A803QTS1_CANSA
MLLLLLLLNQVHQHQYHHFLLQIMVHYTNYPSSWSIFLSGLSKYYQGKSQSFTSLANAVNVEDLPKKVSPYRRKMMMKSCKSYGGGLDSKLHYPKGLISKKSTARGSLLFSRHL